MSAIEMLEFEHVQQVLLQVNQTFDIQAKQTLLKQLQNFDGQLGYLPSLIRLLDCADLGQTISWNDRQFAAILLKNSILRILQQDELRQRHEQELIAAKHFLLRSFGETQHQVFIQLHTLTSKLARVYWPNQWPELIPSLLSVISNEKNFMASFEATCCLHEIMLELACKASSCGPFYPIYYELCLQLFQPIAKYWALRMKSIQVYLASFSTQIPTIHSLHSDDLHNLALSFSRDEVQETSIFYAIVMAKVLKMIIETAYVDIVKRFPCFSCLWKTFMGSIQISAAFIRKVRPVYAQIVAYLSDTQREGENRRQSTEARLIPSNNNRVETALDVSVLERFYSLDVDDFNYSSDFYFPIMQYAAQLPEGYRGLVIVVNLVMKLIKVLNCLPIHLQKKYPLEVVPLLEQLIQFYYKFQIEEISTDLLQNQRLATLPLSSLTFASSLILSNIITCNAYKDYNLYRGSAVQRNVYVPDPNSCSTSLSSDPPTISAVQANSQANAGDVMMDESVTEANVVLANDFIKDFFNPIRVKELFERQLVYSFHYNAPALDTWRSTPEKFFIDEEYIEGMGVEYLYVRTASERLFLALIEIQPDTVTEILMNLLKDVERQNAATISGSSSSQTNESARNAEILLWDAVYTATGLGVEVIASKLGLSPTEWLLKIIGPLFNNLLQSEQCGALQPGGQQILRARMLKLISSWISQFDVAVHPTILQFLVNLLSARSNSDVVVQLCTVKALSSLINVKTFHQKALVPYALPCIEALVNLIQSSLEESETKNLALNLIKDIIQLVGVQILDPAHQISNDYILQLGGYLLRLWDGLDTDDVVRCSVLEVLIVFVQSTKEACVNACPATADPVVSLVERLLVVVSACLSSNHYKSTSSCKNVDTFLIMESLRLLDCIIRNVESKVFVAKFPKAFDVFSSILDMITSNILDISAENAEASLAAKFDTESNAQVVVERACLFVEGYVVSYSEFLQEAGSCEEAKRVIQAVRDFYLQVVKILPPKWMRPVLRSMKVLLLSSPVIMAETLYEANALALPINICCSEASCPNLSGLMKSYFIGHQHTLLACDVLILLILAAPEVLIKSVQVVKNEILAFLFRMTGVTNTNLTEGIILNELICVLLKASKLVEQSSTSKLVCLYRLRWYCFALWSFIKPAAPPSDTCTPATSALKTDNVLPNLFPLESVRIWLKDFSALTSRYLRLCEEYFPSAGTSWLEELYNDQLSEMIKGEFCPVRMDSVDVECICEDIEVFKNIERGSDDNVLMKMLYDILFYERHFSLFQQSVLKGFNSQPAKRIQHVDYQQEIIEREDVIVQEFLCRLFSHNLHKNFLCAFFHQRILTLQGIFGQDFCLQLVSSSMSSQDG